MATDLYGYNRTIKAADQLASSEMAITRIGRGTASGTQIDLAQSVRGEYTHQVQTRGEAGSSTIYWQTGQSVGSLNIGRLVGKGGFMERFGDAKDICGKTMSASVDLSGEGSCPAIRVNAGGSIRFAEAVPQRYGFNYASGQQNLDVSEEITLMCAFMAHG